MSKSYFERRIFGQTDQEDDQQDQAPSLGSLKSRGPQASSQSVPSQPYRFGASRKALRPPISAPESASQSTFVPAETQAPEMEPSSSHHWEASSELRNRLGMNAEAPEEDAYAPQWDAQTAQPMDYAQRAAEQERLMDSLTGQQMPAEPYPLSAPQPSVTPSMTSPAREEEASFGFHSADGPSPITPEPAGQTYPVEHAYEAAPVATTATHAVSPAAAPESAVTEPRMATAAAVGVGQRVNLSDQRAGTSVNPQHYVAASDEMQASAPRGPSFDERSARNPLAGAAAHQHERQRNQASARKPATNNSPSRGMSALPPRPPRRDRGKGGGGGLFGLVRNGLLAVVTLLGLGLLMSVSYAAFQGLRSSPDADVTILLAPDEPVKLRPEQAGIDPEVAAGRTFEADLSVLSNPLGVLEPSDDRYASDSDTAPTMTMNFGGQSLRVAHIDSAQPAVVLEPITELGEGASVAVASSAQGQPQVLPVAATTDLNPLVDIPSAITPANEEPLANASPLANGLSDIAIPKARGTVPSGYEGLVVRVQANTSSAASAASLTPALGTSSAETTLVAGQRGSGSVTLDPASGLPSTPQAPTVTGQAVVSPFGIQLASLRTEQQALNLWVRLQDKYPSLLGGLASRVVKFDSTSRGIFYRLQAGPMPTKTTAVDFCVQLKAQGQECIFVNG